ncbi:hypothetical protein [Streptomyces sp. MNP-20]|uniref:HalD/BesD family halogenase n=1 Tax=Streptomyces sp. MNP-20 TaxID=2721165 RepID=UPI001556FECB|nr:hypothetical protein [Streptomyces sp. MNP-20]
MTRLFHADALARQYGTGAARTRFATDGYLPLPGLLTEHGLAALRAESRGLERRAQRRDFAMACMDGSPRRMTTLGGHVIARESRLIPRLYADGELLALVEAVVGEKPTAVPEALERHVLNILHRQDDTHGAHTDDYPYALVVFLEAPRDPADGGLVEFTPHATATTALTGTGARTAHHAPGDAYLLRSDTTAHRVTPLTRSGVRRTVVNFAYARSDAEVRATPSAHELYG